MVVHCLVFGFDLVVVALQSCFCFAFSLVTSMLHNYFFHFQFYPFLLTHTTSISRHCNCSQHIGGALKHSVSGNAIWSRVNPFGRPMH